MNTVSEDTDSLISWADFSKVDIRVGTVVSAELFAEAKKPAFKILIDFGELGLKKTSAQLTELYEAHELIGKQVVAVINFPPKQIANSISECLVLGAVDGARVTLLTTDNKIQNGLKIA